MRPLVLFVLAAVAGCGAAAPPPAVPAAAPPTEREMPAARWQACLSRIAPTTRPDGYAEVRPARSIVQEDDCWDEARRRSHRAYLDMRASVLASPQVIFVGWFAGPDAPAVILYSEQKQVADRLVVHLDRRVRSLGCAVAGEAATNRLVRADVPDPPWPPAAAPPAPPTSRWVSLLDTPAPIAIVHDEHEAHDACWIVRERAAIDKVPVAADIAASLRERTKDIDFARQMLLVLPQGGAADPLLPAAEIQGGAPEPATEERDLVPSYKRSDDGLTVWAWLSSGTSCRGTGPGPDDRSGPPPSPRMLTPFVVLPRAGGRVFVHVEQALPGPPCA